MEIRHARYRLGRPPSCGISQPHGPEFVIQMQWRQFDSDIGNGGGIGGKAPGEEVEIGQSAGISSVIAAIAASSSLPPAAASRSREQDWFLGEKGPAVPDRLEAANAPLLRARGRAISYTAGGLTVATFGVSAAASILAKRSAE